jgi:FtsH-binding integral membrane protein
MTLVEVMVMSHDRQAPGAQEASSSSPRPPPRETSGAVERVPRHLEVIRDLGWLLTMLSALGALVGGSWMHFPQDSVGMWASYWVTVCSTVAILGCIFLRTSMPTALGVAVTAMAGGVLFLVGVLRDYPTSISVTMIAGGAGIVIGALMQGVRRAGS